MANRKPRPPSRQDATVRNVRASVRRDRATRRRILTVLERVEELERQVDGITKALRALAVI